MNVAVVQCTDYKRAVVEDAFRRLINTLSLPQLEAGKKLRVLIKPNLLTDRPPEAAVTTHPEVVRAIIRFLRQYGHEPVVADSAAGPHKMERIWAATGFAAMCAEESVPLLNLEHAGARVFKFQGASFSIAQPVLEADYIINVPKLKTHLLTVITNAVKNLYGVIPGSQKTALHKIFPTPAMLGAFLAHLHDLVRPGLTICDAVIGMHGNGPSAGHPIHLGFLAAAESSVAMDIAVCRLLGVKPATVPFLSAPTASPSTTAVQPVVIVGDFTDGDNLPKFTLPVTFVRRLIPGWLVRWLRPYLWSRPFFTDTCVRCGRCVAACPTTALLMPDVGTPELNPRACIECGCCNEVCPVNAIETRQALLLRLVQFIRKKTKRLLTVTKLCALP